MNFDFYIKFIYRTDKSHPMLKDVICIFVYDFIKNNYIYYNISHPDLPSNYSLELFKEKYKNSKILLNNKKDYDYFINEFENVIDINILFYIKTGEIIPKYINEEYMYENNSGYITPYIIHQNIFISEIDDILDVLARFDFKEVINEYKFYSYSSDIFFNIEKLGLSIDKKTFDIYFPEHNDLIKDNKVYSYYNILTITGRPSNSFNKINFSALPKNNQCRLAFNSRFNNGKLVLMDFSAYHPSIVSKLIHYEFNDGSIYNHLGYIYYNKKDLTKAEIQYIKKSTMLLFYGDNIQLSLSNIDYFQKVNELKHNIWEFYNKNGYIITPVFERKLSEELIGEISESKLFSYYIQAVETEINLKKLNNIFQYCCNKNIFPILYVYDSIMFDIENLTQNIINDIKHILEEGNFNIKIYIGDNYENLILLN